MGEWSYSSVIRYLGCRLRWVVSFTSLPLYEQKYLTSSWIRTLGVQTVAIQTELPQLLATIRMINVSSDCWEMDDYIMKHDKNYLSPVSELCRKLLELWRHHGLLMGITLFIYFLIWLFIRSIICFFIYLFIYLYVCSFPCLFIQLFSYWYVYLFIQVFIYLFIYLYVCWHVCLFIQVFLYLFIYLCLLLCLFIQVFIYMFACLLVYSFNYLFIHSFIYSFYFMWNLFE
jgi:hypothetical protein